MKKLFLLASLLCLSLPASAGFIGWGDDVVTDYSPNGTQIACYTKKKNWFSGINPIVSMVDYKDQYGSPIKFSSVLMSPDATSPYYRIVGERHAVNQSCIAQAHIDTYAGELVVYNVGIPLGGVTHFYSAYLPNVGRNNYIVDNGRTAYLGAK